MLISVKQAFEKIAANVKKISPHSKIDGVLVQPMVTGGKELILGGRQDPQFGAVVLLGLGGIFVEIFEEVVVRVAPISREDALEMIDSLHGVQMFKGARGQEPC
jgi:acyl-CoA synthetase (NDP forming)